MSGIPIEYAQVMLETAFVSTGDTLYLSLHTAQPEISGATLTNEISGGDYARQVITFETGDSAPEEAEVQNAAQITFPIATADWGLVKWVAISTTSGAAGVVKSRIQLTTDKQISDGDTVQVSAGALKVRLTESPVVA